MICKACKKDFHNCPSCDNDEHEDNGYCTPECYRTIKPKYESFDERIKRLNPPKFKIAKVTRILKRAKK